MRGSNTCSFTEDSCIFKPGNIIYILGAYIVSYLAIFFAIVSKIVSKAKGNSHGCVLVYGICANIFSSPTHNLRSCSLVTNLMTHLMS